MPSFQKSLIVEQFQGNYLKVIMCLAISFFKRKTIERLVTQKKSKQGPLYFFLET